MKNVAKSAVELGIILLIFFGGMTACGLPDFDENDEDEVEIVYEMIEPPFSPADTEMLFQMATERMHTERLRGLSDDSVGDLYYGVVFMTNPDVTDRLMEEYVIYDYLPLLGAETNSNYIEICFTGRVY